MKFGAFPMYVFAPMKTEPVEMAARSLAALGSSASAPTYLAFAASAAGLHHVAPHGAYLSRDQRLDELSIALVVRTRPSTRRSRFHQLSKADGAQGLRHSFGELSSFVRVRLVTALDAVPRPFSVAWQADDD